MRRFRLLLFIAGLLASVPASACDFWLSITFGNGARGCLSDHAIGKSNAPELGRSVADSVPRVGVYAVAVPIAAGARACPAVVGMSAANLSSTAGQMAQPSLPQRLAEAVRRCDGAVRAAGAAAADCGCEPVLVDGVTTLSEPSFALLGTGGASSVVLPVPAPVTATLPGRPAPASPAVEGCDFWMLVTFRDGARGCLSEFGVARSVAPELGRSVADNVPRVGVYVLAAPTRADGSVCSAAVGMSVHVLASTGGQASLPPTATRVADAVRRCESAHRAAGGLADCRCQPVMVDGVSSLDRRAFATLAAPGGSAVATAAVSSPAPVPAAAAAAPLPATARPAPAAQDAATAALQAELAEMRNKLAALERQGTPPASASRMPAQPAAPRQNARALVIGNSAYTSFAALPNPRNDARAIAARLRSYGIAVDLVVDADRDTLIQALAEYSSRAAGSDVNILFYAGHGVQVEGINYIVPTNMRADGISAGYIKLAGIALNAVLDYLPARTRIVFLDACRDNPVSRSLLASRSAGGIGLAPTNTATGTLIAYATKDGSVAEDGAGANSPYTTALLAHLDAPQDISLVLRQVRQTVMRMTSNRQEPWEYGSLIGDQLVLSQMAGR